MAVLQDNVCGSTADRDAVALLGACMADEMRYRHAIALIDAANSDDPNQALDQGRMRPAELVYAERMTTWLARLYPHASEPLALAARAQHIRRWTVERATYPQGRAGYPRWRNDLKRRHAELAGEILGKCGYAADEIARVQALIRKERLKRDPEAQALEDVVCLVFLEHYFADFARKHDDEKLVAILRKTWAKMSETGHAAALALPLDAAAQAMIERALSDEPAAEKAIQVPR
ncbi:MAG: DUF4202 domain-containing protein [Methyloligellaceae bacterium]